jgi:hypothetical protein
MVPSGDSAMPATGASPVGTFSLTGWPGRPSAEMDSRKKVIGAVPAIWERPDAAAMTNVRSSAAAVTEWP